MAYELAIDVDKIAALDIHVHVWRSERDGAEQQPNAVQQAASRHFRTNAEGMTVSETAAFYRQRNMACVLFGMDTESARGRRGVGNDEVIELASKHNDVIIPFANVDPWRGKDAVRDAERFIKAGARGFKFHPPSSAFYPNDEQFFPLYEVINAAKLPALFHTGQTGIGAGVPGGGGIHLKYGNPMYLDDVAVEFHDMPIILAHPSVPWQDEALSVAVHKPQVYIDLSGWSPKYFPPQLVHYSNTLIKNKVLFGSDHPLFTPDRWMADFQGAPFKEEVRPLILKENAIRLLGLKPSVG
ncbi:MAG: amidohydrolase [Chloroflexota bacterium]|nr:amidohydrolase [Chloroflexota bacterium]